MNSQMTTTHMPNLWNGFLKEEENSDSDEKSESVVMLAPNPTTEPERLIFGFDES
jgi:hypothetical protein